jgi:hypothetical protein
VGVNEEALMEIQNMECVLDLEVYHSFFESGNEISPAIDIRSDAGGKLSVNLFLQVSHLISNICLICQGHSFSEGE